MDIKKININDIKPYERNNKKHPEAQIKELVRSIKKYGLDQPVLLDKHNEIIAGHGRYLAAKEVGYKEVPCIVTTLEGVEAAARRIIDNKLPDDAVWDAENILFELDFLEAEGFDLSEFGLDDFKNRFFVEDDLEATEDDYTEPEGMEIKIQLGDLIELNDHRVLCGDSTLDESYEQLMEDELADMVFTDPPYNVNYEGGTKDKLTIQNDNQGNDEFRQFLFDMYSALSGATKQGGAIYVCHADSESYNFRGALVDAGWLLKQCIIWVKQSIVMGRQDYHWKHEPILYGWLGGASHNWYSDRKQSTVWEIDRPSKSREHPTMKPVKLVEKAVQNSSKQGDIVCDPFLGSGSTLIACEQLKRKCYGIELEPRYCQVIIDRFIKYCEGNNIEQEVKVNGKTWA